MFTRFANWLSVYVVACKYRQCYSFFFNLCLLWYTIFSILKYASDFFCSHLLLSLTSFFIIWNLWLYLSSFFIFGIHCFEFWFKFKKKANHSSLKFYLKQSIHRRLCVFIFWCYLMWDLWKAQYLIRDLIVEQSNSAWWTHCLATCWISHMCMFLKCQLKIIFGEKEFL